MSASPSPLFVPTPIAAASTKNGFLLDETDFAAKLRFAGEFALQCFGVEATPFPIDQWLPYWRLPWSRVLPVYDPGDYSDYEILTALCPGYIEMQDYQNILRGPDEKRFKSPGLPRKPQWWLIQDSPEPDLETLGAGAATAQSFWHSELTTGASVYLGRRGYLLAQALHRLMHRVTLDYNATSTMFPSDRLGAKNDSYLVDVDSPVTVGFGESRSGKIRLGFRGEHCVNPNIGIRRAFVFVSA